MTGQLTSLFLCPLLLSLLTAEPAFAYVGPGAGLTVIGSILAFLGLIFLAIFGFLWYPIKRLITKRKQSASVATVSREQHAEKVDNPRQEPAQK
ncbi:MAG: hypothetical protein MN733_02535 [Nitrososphaera sp.]|nr:hypothetical protein [Nitrososphaera sp.]